MSQMNETFFKVCENRLGLQEANADIRLKILEIQARILNERHSTELFSEYNVDILSSDFEQIHENIKQIFLGDA